MSIQLNIRYRWMFAFLGVATFSLGCSAVGYYFGRSHDIRYQDRIGVSNVLVSTYSLDSIYLGNCDYGNHLVTFELAIDRELIRYANSHDGGSIGINNIWMRKSRAANNKQYARQVAAYRKGHKQYLKFLHPELDSLQSARTNALYEQKLDSIAELILKE